MEHLRRRVGHAVLIFSLVLNLILLTATGLIWKTNLFDAPLLGFLVNKNCASGELIDTQDSEAGRRLLDLVCNFSEQFKPEVP